MSLKQMLLRVAGLSGLAMLARQATGTQLRILCYHGLWVTPGHQFGNHLFMRPEQFDARMARLRRSGLPVLGLDVAVAGLAAGTLPPRAVVVTIDDGWASTHSHMLPILEAHRLPATLYATTWYSARDLPVVNVAVDYLIAASGRHDLDREACIHAIEALAEVERLDALRDLGGKLGVDEQWLELRQFHLMQAGELADASRRGLDIQLHTHRHIDVASQIERLPREIDDNRAFLEPLLGSELGHFCYPSGTFHPDAPRILAQRGVRSATLVEEGLNPCHADPYTLRRFVDGRTVTDLEFDAYLDGTLHYLRRPGALGRGRTRRANRIASPPVAPSRA